jgi:hypothetical protein
MALGCTLHFFHLSRWENSHLSEWGMSPKKVQPAANRPVNMVVTHLVGSSEAKQLNGAGI